MWVRSPTAKNDGRKSAIVKDIDEVVNHSRYLGAAGCDFAGAALDATLGGPPGGPPGGGGPPACGG